jgi:heme/copper-type cytochrome/quinol oxidase subunit 2
MPEFFNEIKSNSMESVQEDRKIEMDPEILNSLNSTRKWTTFLSVLGFIFLGLLIVAGLTTSLFLTTFKTQEANLGIPESVMIIIFITVGAIYFFPVFFLFRFSRNTRDAIQNLDRKKLAKGLNNLRLYFTYIGIMVIVVLSIYVVALFAAGASLSFLKGI